MIKNAIIYRITKPIDLDDAKLATCAFKPVTGSQMESMGFVPPVGFDENEFSATVKATNSYTMLTVKVEQKIMPAAAVNKKLAEKVAEIEKREGREIYRKEKTALKEELIQGMLPRAFSREKHINIIVMHEANLLIVDTGSRKVSEEVLCLLREALGSLSVVPVSAPSVAHLMTTALSMGKSIIGSIGSQCKLIDPVSGAAQTFKNMDLDSEEVLAHIKAGSRVEAVEINFPDAMTFTLTADLDLKKIKFAESIDQRIEASEPDSIRAQTQATLLITAAALEVVFVTLFVALEVH